MNMTGYEYEYLYALYLECMGYSQVEVTKRSGDHGVDIIARKFLKSYALQCKFHAKPLGNKAIQEVYSGANYYGCDHAIVVTNNTFTKSAIDEAQKLKVTLVPEKTVETLVKECTKKYKKGNINSKNELLSHLPINIQKAITSGNIAIIVNYENDKPNTSIIPINNDKQPISANNFIPTSKICPKCGREYLSHSAICAICGCQLINITSSEQQAVVSYSYHETTYSSSTIVERTYSNNTTKNKEQIQPETYQNIQISFWLCLFLGIFGAHKFYQEKPFLGFLYLSTLGLFGVGWFIDLITIASALEKASNKKNSN